MKKRIISFVMALMMVAAIFPFNAFAAEIVDSGQCGDNAYWTLDSNGTLTISGTGAMWDWDYVETTSSPWHNNHAIYKVEVKNGITTIGKEAFSVCASLTSVTIPNSVTSIGNSAFSGCTSLASVTIPNSVTSIGSSAFSGCTSLTSVTVPNGVTKIGNYAFSKCASLTSMTIPNSVTSIGYSAFSRCTSLTSVTIPNSVTTIDSHVFYCCASLKSVVIPNSVTSIRRFAFHDCTSLTSVTIPNSVTSIENSAFSDCSSLTSVTIPNSLTTIGDYAFDDCTSLTSVTIPNSVTSIGANAFYHCSSLTSVTIPNSVKIIGKSAFSGCKFLTSVVIPTSVTTIDESAFSICLSLTDVFYSGSETQWQSISIGNNNSYLTNATIRYRSTGEHNGNQSANIYNSGVTTTYTVYAATQQEMLSGLSIDTSNMLHNISVMNDPIKGPSVKFLGKTFYLFEMDGKVNLKFKNLNVQAKADRDKKTVQILVGFKPFNESADLGNQYNDDSYWSNSYQQVKSLYQSVNGKNVDTTKLWNQFSSIRGQLKELNSDLLVDAKCKVAGYIELSFESGQAKFSEGGFLMEASIGGEFVGRVPAFPIAYAVAGLEASLEGKIAVAYEKYISISSEINAKLAANVGVGIGTKRAKTYIEGGLKGELGFKLLAITGSFAQTAPSFDPVTVTLKGDVYLKGSLLGFLSGEKTWPIGSPVQLYPRNTASLMSFDLFDDQPISQVIANSTPLSREYLYRASLMGDSGTDKLYSDTAVYPYCAPVITTLTDGRLLMLWVDDLGTKNDVNKTSLMFSIYDGGVWSGAEPLFETGTYNGSPALYNDGGTVHVIWARAKTVFGEDAGLAELITDTELYYTRFEDGAFSQPIKLTDNELMEIDYTVTAADGKIAVTWIENSENDPYMSSGVNTVRQSECINGSWTDKPSVIATGKSVCDIEVFYTDGEAKTAFVLADQNNDTELYIDGEYIRGGDCPGYWGGRLYYLSERAILAYDPAEKRTEDTGLTAVSNFSVENGAAYALVNDGFACELYESGDFSSWKQVTEFGKYIRDYSVTLDERGEPIYALNLVEITDGESIYGSSELAVCGKSDISAVTVTAAYYDEEDVVPGGALPLNIEMTNSGTTDIDSVNIRLTDADGKLLSQGAVQTHIPSDESGILTYIYDLPDSLELYSVNVLVTVGEAEKNLDDNTAAFSVGYADTEMTELYIVRNDNNAEIQGTVVNNGFTAAENAVVRVYNSGEPETILSEIECGQILPDGKADFTFALPQEYMSIDDPLTLHGLCFTVESDSDELNYANNTDKILFGELTEYTTALVSDGELVDIVKLSQLDGYEIHKEGFWLEGWYISDSFAEADRIASGAELTSDMLLYAHWLPTDESLYVRDVTVERAGNTVRVSVGCGYVAETVNMIAALYKDGKMVGYAAKSVAAGTKTTDFSFEAENSEYTVKVFALDGGYRPLIAAISRG